MPVVSEEGEEREVIPGMTEGEEDGLKEFSSSRGTGSRPRVRRCLFGEVDRDANRRDLLRIREEQTTNNKRKWNFDFESGRPLEGQYQWTRVRRSLPLSAAPSTACAAPAVDCTPSGDELAGRVNLDLDAGESSLSGDSSSGEMCRSSDLAECSIVSIATKTHSRQTTIRNYFRVKKRSAHKQPIPK